MEKLRANLNRKACNRNNQLLERTEFGGYTVHITIQEYRGTHFVLA